MNDRRERERRSSVTTRRRERETAPARSNRRRRRQPGSTRVVKRLLAVAFIVGAIILLISLFNHVQASKETALTSEPDVRRVAEEVSTVDAWEEETSSPGLTEEQVKEKLLELQEVFPDGRYWNHMGIELDPDEECWNYTTDIPCDHSRYGDRYCNRYDGVTKEFFPQYDHLTQCLGFSSMLSDKIFGEDAPITIYRDFDKVRLGDQIRLTGDLHSMVVIEKGDDYVKVAECDEDCETCMISWGRTLFKSDLASYGEEIEYMTRYES